MTTYGLYLALSLCFLPLGSLAITLYRKRYFTVLTSICLVLSFLLFVYTLLVDFKLFGLVKLGGEPIRIDLLIIIPLFSTFYLFAGIFGFIIAKSLNSIVSLISALILFSISTTNLVFLVKSTYQSLDSIEKLDSVPELLNQAKFSNAERFNKYFGSIDTSKNSLVGNFISKIRIDSRSWVKPITRVIINKEGSIFLFVPCKSNRQIDCLSAVANIDLKNFIFPKKVLFQYLDSTSKEEWIFTNVNENSFEIALGGGRDKSSASYQASELKREPVHFTEPTDFHDNVKYLGAYSQEKINGTKVEIIQILLWQEDLKYMAYYHRGNYTCGRQNNFPSADFFIGEKKEGNIFLKNDSKDSRESTIIKIIDENTISGEIFYGKEPFNSPLNKILLKKKLIFEFKNFELAPLNNLEDTTNWLKTIWMTGHRITFTEECKQN